MRLAPRVDYDEIAHRYDSQPYRERALDAELSGFVEQRNYGDALVVLDVGCGTGNQLIANRVAAPGGLLVGVDCSHGMLRQARVKAPDLAWVHGDAAALPLASRCTAYVGCQFAFHHFADKAGALREVLRVLRPGGRFVLRNFCPQRSGDWLYYAYFPQARVIDLEDFWPQCGLRGPTVTAFSGECRRPKLARRGRRIFHSGLHGRARGHRRRAFLAGNAPRMCTGIDTRLGGRRMTRPLQRADGRARPRPLPGRRASATSRSRPASSRRGRGGRS